MGTARSSRGATSSELDLGDDFGWSLAVLLRTYRERVSEALGAFPHGTRGYETLAEVLREAALAVDNGFITCDPAIEPRSCAREVLEPFMERAWRRPVTAEEVDGVLRYLDVVAQEGDETDAFPQAIRLGIQHVLMAPNFLFRFEQLEDPTSPRAQAA